MITPKTYSKIIHLQSDAIFNFLNKNLKNRATAEDLTQECFLKLWKNSLFLKEEVAKSWLFKTAYNLMLNHIRDNKKIDFHAELIDNQKIDSHNKLDQNDFIETIFTYLTIEQKTILVLRDQEAYTYKEIAEILNISEENVKVKIFRSRQKFKEVYEFLNSNEKTLRYE
jgi:RNA polymerase sigma factor (sigma-70 family)